MSRKTKKGLAKQQAYELRKYKKSRNLTFCENKATSIKAPSTITIKPVGPTSFQQQYALQLMAVCSLKPRHRVGKSTRLLFTIAACLVMIQFAETRALKPYETNAHPKNQAKVNKDLTTIKPEAKTTATIKPYQPNDFFATTSKEYMPSKEREQFKEELNSLQTEGKEKLEIGRAHV